MWRRFVTVRHWRERKPALPGSEGSLDANKLYNAKFQLCENFCHRRSFDPIRIVGDHNRSKQTNVFLDFVVHCATNVLRSSAMIKTQPSAVKSPHANLGLDDPIAPWVRRVELLLHGYTRLRGAPQRRHPVTPRMLR